jgi:hypothetical protein
MYLAELPSKFKEFCMWWTKAKTMDKWGQRGSNCQEVKGCTLLCILLQVLVCFNTAQNKTLKINILKTDTYIVGRVINTYVLIIGPENRWSMHQADIYIYIAQGAPGGLNASLHSSISIYEPDGERQPSKRDPNSVGAALHRMLGSHRTLYVLLLDSSIIFFRKTYTHLNAETS